MPGSYLSSACLSEFCSVVTCIQGFIPSTWSLSLNINLYMVLTGETCSVGRVGKEQVNDLNLSVITQVYSFPDSSVMSLGLLEV
jgi:hypothetical protein